MSKKNKSTWFPCALAALALGGTALLVPDRASALTVRPNTGGPSQAIYLAEIFGNQYAVFTNGPSNCTFQQIGNSAGLWQPVLVEGDNVGNYIEIVEQPYSNICGYPLQPLKRNGLWVDIKAKGGNDTLWTSSWDNTGINLGELGGDVIFARGGTGSGYSSGGADGDILVALANEVWVEGSDGDDVLCLQTSRGRAGTADGGPGYDGYCGTASQTNRGLEVPFCGSICPYY